jgi:hypothetical protein
VIDAGYDKKQIIPDDDLIPLTAYIVYDQSPQSLNPGCALGQGTNCEDASSG